MRKQSLLCVWIALNACVDRAVDFQAESTEAIPNAEQVSLASAGLPYPVRSAYRLKALQPDFWPKPEDVIGNNAGGIAVNTVWAFWEPTNRAPPCQADQEEFQGRCFTVDANADTAIARYSAAGLVVTAVVYGVPAWARANRTCSPVAPGFEIFCAPDNASDYGRFAGMLARRYNGQNGHGRIADFVIHNEINSNDWFDIGCGQGVACDVNAWLDTYAASFNSAYDNVTSQQSSAKVLISLLHAFDPELDNARAKNPVLSAMTVLRGLAPRLAPRAWRVAFHPYPPDLLAAKFGAEDYPKVTYGNIGVLAGFLAKEFPSVPSAREIQLTESGVNSLGPKSSESAQAEGVCRSFENVLGTPGIESYVYHRMTDHPDETKDGLGVGLTRTDKTFKPAWAVWALANRNDLTPPRLSCGFEHLPFTKLRRFYNPQRGHWTSTRRPPEGFKEEAAWRLRREPLPGQKMLYECQVGSHNLISAEANCEGLRPLGPVGGIFTENGPGRTALYRCYVPSGSGDHFVSTAANCEGQRLESLLGYAE
jgi:hypothetical protein